MDRMDEYEVVGSFDCGDRRMVVIKAAHGTHVMHDDEWELMKQGVVDERSKPHQKNYKAA